jgi:hypothetical protein
MSSWDEEGYEVTAAVESTGNTSTFATSLWRQESQSELWTPWSSRLSMSR